MRGKIAPTRCDYTDIEGQGLTMYSNEEIMQFVFLIVEVADPDRIILYGSYAYGNPNDKSDLDFLVIKNGKEITVDDETKLSVAIYNARKQRSIKTRYDVFFGTDEQARVIAERGGACKDALEKGRVLYERSYQ